MSYIKTINTLKPLGSDDQRPIYKNEERIPESVGSLGLWVNRGACLHASWTDWKGPVVQGLTGNALFGLFRLF